MPLKRDPGQILVTLDKPKPQPIKATGEVCKASLERKPNPRPCFAFRLVDYACAIAEQDDLGFACRKCHFESEEQCEPFGVAARSRTRIMAEMDRAPEDGGDMDRTRIGAGSAVEIDFGQCASDQASTNVPSLRKRRAA